MVVTILIVYGLGVIIAGIGVYKYRNKIKSSNMGNTKTTVDNQGTPVKNGLAHLKIICK